MNRFSASSVAISMLAFATICSSPVQAADYFGAAVIEDPICSNGTITRNIRERFSYQVRHVPNLPQVAISTIYNARQTRHEPSTHSHPIERVYCAATAQLSNGQNHSIWYLVEYGMGFAGVGDNVEFCLADFDRWNVYNAACSTLR